MGKSNKYLAYIEPLEDYTDKKECLCSVYILTGDLKGKSQNYMLTTDIYRYSFYGTTMEVITIDEKGFITDIHDVASADDMEYFKLGLITAMTYEQSSTKVLGSDGFIYRLNQSSYYNRCRNTCENIFKRMDVVYNFVMCMYTLNGGVIYIDFSENVQPDKKLYKYAVHKGFVTNDEKVLRSMSTSKSDSGNISGTNSNEKLTQKDIDKLIEDIRAYHS